MHIIIIEPNGPIKELDCFINDSNKSAIASIENIIPLIFSFKTKFKSCF